MLVGRLPDDLAHGGAPGEEDVVELVLVNETKREGTVGVSIRNGQVGMWNGTVQAEALQEVVGGRRPTHKVIDALKDAAFHFQIERTALAQLRFRKRREVEKAEDW